LKALNATDRFLKNEKPLFDMMNIIPSFFIGRNEIVTDTKDFLTSTNTIAFAPVLGQVSDFANPGTTIHVNDVAKAHVLVLDPKIKGSQNFGMQSGKVDGNIWESSIDIVKKHFPDAVKDGRLPANGKQPTKRLLYDTSRTEQVFGMKFKSYEEQVVSVAAHYLELLEKATGGKGGVSHGQPTGD